MCDVMVAMPDVTASGRVLFGKNSDRPSGECQVLFWDPGGSHPPAEQARCSYRSVPRGSSTLATLGLRPYWCWGYETGVNEAGVAGGNAAVFTVPPGGREAETGLTGMDLLRFALERGESAKRCVEEATTLLARYGQWGSAARGKEHSEGSYDNSFLFADAEEAWVLETAGRSWAAERVTSGVRTISNELTIRDRFDRASSDVESMRKAAGSLDFAYAFEDHAGYPRQVSHIRRMRTHELLSKEAGRIGVDTVMRVLRDHYEDTFLGGPSFNRYLPDFLTVCMHDSPAQFTWGDTATSMVAELGGPPALPLWVAYLPPCSSAYLPLRFGEPLPPQLSAAGSESVSVSEPATAAPDTFDRGSLWWRIHRLVKEAAREPRRRHEELRKAFDPLEHDWLERYAPSTTPERSPERPAVERRASDSLASRTESLLAAIERIELQWGLHT